jgi:hypothetical protein
VELQVRTIFEEGWSEIDHRIRYPRQSDNPYLANFLAIFNRLAGSADEMGTFIKALAGHVTAQAEKMAEQERDLRKKEDALQKAISELKINSQEKEKLKRQLSEFRSASVTGAPPTTSFASLLENWGPENSIFKYMTSHAIPTICGSCGKTYPSMHQGLIGVPSLCLECQRSQLSSFIRTPPKPSK